MSPQQDVGASGPEASDHKHSRHFSAKEKSKAVLRVLKGENENAVAEDTGVSVSRLERWRVTFLSGGLASLETKEHHNGLYQTIKKNSKEIMQWAVLLIALLMIIRLVIHSLYQDSGQ